MTVRNAADTPLSERLLAAVPGVPAFAVLLREAAELARRVEAAPVETVPKPPPDIECSGIMFLVPICVAGKRVALVEVPGE